MAVVTNTGQTAYKTDLEGLFDTIQEQRAALLTMVRDTQLAARLLAVEEAARIKTDVAPDDPRVSRYMDSSAAILRRASALEVETEIANIRTPPVTKTQTLLQGRITDDESKASAHVTVTLVDDKGAVVQGVAPVETDDSGYYAFVLDPDQVKAVGDRNLTLQVGTDSGKLVPSASTPFTLASGKINIAETKLQPSELESLRLRIPIRDLSRAAGAATKAAAKSAVAKTAAAPAAKKRKSAGKRGSSDKHG